MVSLLGFMPYLFVSGFEVTLEHNTHFEQFVEIKQVFIYVDKSV
jgi:hypothetical protein